MNSLTNNNKINSSNDFNNKDLKHNEVAASENEKLFNKAGLQQKIEGEDYFGHDANTASYVRGYN